MSSFIGEHQYLTAWLVYLAAGFVFCLWWWRLTAGIRYIILRDLLRGPAVVFIGTPWFASNAWETLAPAALVALMDLLWGDPANGTASLLILALATLFMILVVIVRWRLRRRPAPVASRFGLGGRGA